MDAKPYVTKTGVVIDPERFLRNGETLMFRPFKAERTKPLAKAIRAGALPPEAELLVLVLDDGQALALSRSQLAYHHVAQGELGGQPWAVFF